MIVHVSATAIYLACCGTAATGVALGLLAANIAMLLVLVVMVGVGITMGKKP